MKILQRFGSFKVASSPAYGERVEDSVDSTEREGLIPDSETNPRQESRAKSLIHHYGIWHLAFVASQSITVAVLIICIMIADQGPSEITCARKLSPYSPALETGDVEYEEFTDQNHLMQPSPYRGNPTPEIEEAWIRLWRLPTIHFPEEHMVALNKSPPASYVHVADEYGGGMLGFLDVFHQLHCLNMIRQYTYRDVYDYSNVTAFRASDELVRGHVDHCIETVRRAIMCTSDVTPMVFNRDSSRASGGKSDFNIKRKCRNFSKIQDWAIKNRGYPDKPA
ncbi:hypothetical protein F4820DRAFT_471924 [Hypoxylon rubiginosum]|uniref:Uncharacterized protein n=1 Tax=Hypoxylon rubiginosum TaxID=110542 RepID=A0ACB9YUD3_9PEZI|nr:hypothetical protein F4820DRAFT_471924 [Hypoxylon rubiginosum]